MRLNKFITCSLHVLHLYVIVHITFLCFLSQLYGNNGSYVHKPTKFSLLKSCHRSSQPILGLTNANSLQECQAFCVSVKGLAFNYSPFEKLSCETGRSIDSGNGTLFPHKSSRRHIIDQAENFYRCHALACPENEKMVTLISDQRFDYYTLYARHVPSLNTTCIPELGVFQFHETKQNYDTAYSTCRTQSKGALAHIVSDSRTNKLADLLRNLFEKRRTTSRAVFAGLNYSWPEQEFRTSEWENLQSFAYRAWGPGYPRQHGNHSCVALKIDRSWMTVDCNKALPFICEVYTSVSIWEAPVTCLPSTKEKVTIECTRS